MGVTLLVKCHWGLKKGYNGLWSRCIKVWYKLSCIDKKPLVKVSIPGIWNTISKIIDDVRDWVVNLKGLMVRHLGNGKSSHFRKDKWSDRLILKDLFMELYCIEVNKNYRLVTYYM